MGAISPFCDLVREIAELNIEPIICDYYSDAPAKKMGYRSYDISTTDTDSILELAKDEHADGIICAFSDRNLMPAYTVCEVLHLNHFFSREIIECLTDKHKMKHFFTSHGYPVVKYGVVSLEELDTASERFHFPVLTKPVDAYGSKGIFLCNTLEEIKAVTGRVLHESLNYRNRIIVEEYYQADEISVSAWVKDGRAYITCIYDVFRNIENTFTLSAVAFPSKYSYTDLEDVNYLLNQIISDRGVEDGPVTLQCFIGADGIKVSELLCRLAGGSPYLYPTFFGGPNLAKMVISHAVGEIVDYQNLFTFKPVIEKDDVFFDVQVLVNHKGSLYYGFDKEDVIKANSEIVDIVIYYANGHKLVNVSSAGVVFAKVICKTKRTCRYADMVKRLEDDIVVYDEEGSKSSFIRKPQRLNVVDTYKTDWAFLNK